MAWQLLISLSKFLMTLSKQCMELQYLDSCHVTKFLAVELANSSNLHKLPVSLTQLHHPR